MDNFMIDFLNNEQIFNFDKEQNILNLMLMYTSTNNKNDVLLFHNNSFERKILNFLQNERSFIGNNDHDCLPPDFYSNEYSCMFDVLRINDSEVKKTYNPIISQEHKMKKEFEKENLLESAFFQVAFEAGSSGDVNEHSFSKYKKQSQRVIKEHITKIPIWVKEHLGIKHKGLFIFDESGACFEGTKIYVGNNNFSYSFKPPLKLHETWNDYEFMKEIYDEKLLDFVVWFNPYKNANEILYKYNSNKNHSILRYPALVIVDVRFNRDNYKEYNYEKLIMAT